MRARRGSASEPSAAPARALDRQEVQALLLELAPERASLSAT